MLLFLDTLFFNICIYISVLRKKASGKRKNNIVKELFSHNRYTHSSLGPDSARTLRQSSLYTSFPASSGISGTACARHCLYSILSKIGHCCCYEHYFFFFFCGLQTLQDKEHTSICYCSFLLCLPHILELC